LAGASDRKTRSDKSEDLQDLRVTMHVVLGGKLVDHRIFIEVLGFRVHRKHFRGLRETRLDVLPALILFLVF
jgi:hypothetical protein